MKCPGNRYPDARQYTPGINTTVYSGSAPWVNVTMARISHAQTRYKAQWGLWYDRITTSTWASTGYVWTTNHNPGNPIGGNAVWLDGHCSWIDYTGKWVSHTEAGQFPKEAIWMNGSHPNNGWMQLRHPTGATPQRTNLSIDEASRVQFLGDF